MVEKDRRIEEIRHRERESREQGWLRPGTRDRKIVREDVPYLLQRIGELEEDNERLREDVRKRDEELDRMAT